MKRVFAVISVLVLVLFIPLMAFAAEPASYIFEVMPSVSTFGNYDFVYNADAVGFYSGQVPPGTYDVIFHVYDSGESFLVLSVSPVVVNYVLDEGVPIANFEISIMDEFSQTFAFTCFIVDLFSSDGFSVAGLIFEDSEYPLPDGSFIELVSVDDSFGVISYSDIQDFFAPVYDQLSVASVVGTFVGVTGTCSGVAFGWWGVRKIVRFFMSAFRKGKISL